MIRSLIGTSQQNVICAMTSHVVDDLKPAFGDEIKYETTTPFKYFTTFTGAECHLLIWNDGEQLLPRRT